MKRTLLPVVLLIFPMIAIGVEPDIASLVQAELNFSKLSVEKGRKHSFVENFAEDSIIFRPGPVNGKKWYQERPDGSGILSWRPSLSEIAASGDFGYNTGPWEFRQKPGDSEAGYGQFFSVWRKMPDGKWKVIFDHGYEHPKRDDSSLTKILPQVSTVSNSKNTDIQPQSLLEIDRNFSNLSKEQGTSKAYMKFLSQKTRVMRSQQLPESDRNKALELISQEKGALTWEPKGGDIAASGDLGYTYGLSDRVVDGKVEKGNYVRTWRKEGDEWKVAVDLMTPFPQ